MSEDSLWLTFAETGDPICYLLYRAAGQSNDDMQQGSGEHRPQARA